MLCNDFLIAKRASVGAKELTQRSWDDYKAACELVIEKFGKARLVADLDPDDFAKLRGAMVGKGWGPVTLGNVIQRVRVVFKFAYDNGSIDRPVRYGQNFKRPTRKTVRVDRAKKGPKLFTATEVRALIEGATVEKTSGPKRVQLNPVMRAMVLLGINAGLGNADCGQLRLVHIDLDAGTLDYPRPKTGIPRRCVLWPQTVTALRAALAVRPTPKDAANAELVFVTTFGGCWAKDSADQTLAKEFAKVLRAFRFAARTGLGFYTLRHTFRTVADEAKDQPAADYIMGHESPHMSSHYRETISDERLKAISRHVHEWVFGPLQK
jgi:integrase